MPPLLPECLSQPVQVVVQTNSSDVSGPLWTLAGVALGAVLGYWANKRLEAARLKLEKLEEIAVFSADIERSFARYANAIILGINENAGDEIQRQRLGGFETLEFNSRLDRLAFMMEVHFNERPDLSKEFRDSMIAAGNEISFMVNQPNPSPGDEQISDFRNSLRPLLFNITQAQRKIQNASIVESKKLTTPIEYWRAILKKFRSYKK